MKGSEDDYSVQQFTLPVVRNGPTNPEDRRRKNQPATQRSKEVSNQALCWQSLSQALGTRQLNIDELVRGLYSRSNAAVFPSSSKTEGDSDRMEDIPSLQLSLSKTEGDSDRMEEIPSLQLSLSKTGGDSDRMEEIPSLQLSLSKTGGDSDRIEDIPSLQLSLEECFFLHHVMGTINVYFNDRVITGHNELWQLFKQTQDHMDEKMFVARYAAYFYFRSKGWVVKDGLKFGADFILYKDGPECNHSLFCVTIIRVLHDGRIETKLPPRYLSGLVRVSKSVKKHPIVCYVKLPNRDEVSFDDPILISKCTIRCVHIERWDSDSGLK